MSSQSHDAQNDHPRNSVFSSETPGWKVWRLFLLNAPETSDVGWATVWDDAPDPAKTLSPQSTCGFAPLAAIDMTEGNELLRVGLSEL